MMNNVLITGASGFLGGALLRELLLDRNNVVYALLRTENKQASIIRRQSLISEIKMPGIKNLERLHFICGDISETKIGLDKKNFDLFRKKLNTIYHCAAKRDFDIKLKDIRKVNVAGTENLFEAALKWNSLKAINYVSTAYIAGNFNGVFKETQLDVGQKFNNSYEQSKFEAERLILFYRGLGLKIDVFRPGVIIDAYPPDEKKQSILLKMFPLCALHMPKNLPASPYVKLNFIPVDSAAKAIYLISISKNKEADKTYHIAGPALVTIETLFIEAGNAFGFKVPEFVNAAEFKREKLNIMQRRLLKAFSPYLNQHHVFDCSNTLSILGKSKYKITGVDNLYLRNIFRKK